MFVVFSYLEWMPAMLQKYACRGREWCQVTEQPSTICMKTHHINC